MKKALLWCLLLVVVCVSCYEPSQSVGSLEVRISSSAKTIEPTFDLGRCAKYVITVKSVGSESLMTFETTDDSYVVEQLVVGDYEVHVVGCNTDGVDIITSETIEVSVTKDRTSSVLLSLDEYVSGNGRFSFSVCIPVKDNTVDEVWFSLFDASDAEFKDSKYSDSVSVYSISSDGRYRVYSIGLELPAGSYNMVACPMEVSEGVPSAVGVPYMESLHVFNGTLSESRIVWDPRFFPVVSDPVFSIEEGPCKEGTALRIVSTDSRASIYYTTDGSEPSKDSTLYIDLISIDRCMTVKAVAVVDGLVPSRVVSARYTVKAETPVLRIKDGLFMPYDGLEIVSATKDASIYYTMDGTRPSKENGILYTGPMTLDKTIHVEAIALKDGLEPSDVVSTTYYRGDSPSPEFLFSLNGQGAISIRGSVSEDLIPEVLILPSTVNGREVVEIAKQGFAGLSKLRGILMPETVKRIGPMAFAGCTGIEDINISKYVESLEGSAFQGCTSLVDVTLPDTVTTLGDGVFSNCTALKSVDLGSGVTVIPEEAFHNSPNLTSITATSCMGGMDISVTVPLDQLVVHAVKVEVKPTYAATAVGSYSKTIPRSDSSATEDGRVFSYSIHSMLGLTYTTDVTLLDSKNNVVGVESRQVQVSAKNTATISIEFPLSDIKGGSLPAIVIGPDEATVSDGDEISISCEDADAVYYTLDGTIPSPENGLKGRYEGPFAIHSSATVKVVAVKEGCFHRSYERKYDVNVLKPKFKLDSDKKYPSTQKVELETKTEGATIWYTTDGSDPMKYGKKYSGAIEVSNTTTIRAVAKKDGLVESDVVEAQFKIEIPSHEVVTPVVLSVEIQRLYENNRAGFEAVVDSESSNVVYSWYLDYVFAGNGKTYWLPEDVADDHHIVEVIVLVDGELCSNELVVYGNRGPSGGYVFYDCDADNDPNVNEGRGEDNLMSTECGWRYLEAAPADLRVVDGKPTVDSAASGYDSAETRYIFGFYRTSASEINTNTSIGSGEANTQKLVEAMGDNAYTSESGSGTTDLYAARLCSELVYGGFKDWFLPSRDELILMDLNLENKGIGSFADNFYWSSSEGSASNAWIQYFDIGGLTVYSRNYDGYVRPIRAF